MDVPGFSPLTPGLLDALAEVVATALDEGDDDRAWTVTCALEELSGTGADSGRPPSPVIGRRFAMAHRRLLTAVPLPGAPAPRPSGGRTPRAVVAHP